MPTFSRGVGLRRFQVVSPVCMGRRSSKIATRKNAQDARKSKLYGKFGKQIISAVKAAGPSPGSNSALAALLVAAKQGGVPKDVIDRNIKRATEKGQADFTEIVYEIYGLGGVGIVVDVLTDNNARAAATVRDVVRKGGAKMADPGSVLFNFKRQGVLAVPAATADPDEVLVVAVDAGADDVINPGEDIAGGGGGGHAEEGEEEEQFFRVLTPAESFASVRAELQEYGLTVDAEHSGLMFIPTATMQPDEEAREQNEAVMEKLLELDDVDAVYCNQ
ncbi:unnamed protein product [Closterium sp. NIES-65]|nr:unnamed protein product [Closterium sp. NIES-65]